MTPDPFDDELGFDESEDLDDDDLVVLEQADGSRLACVILAVVEHDGRTYALLSPQASANGGGDDDDEGDILVATYEEDPDGTARIGTLEDESVLAALQDVVKDLVGFDEEVDGVAIRGRNVPEA